jgi:hypothetical protein
MSQDIEPVKIIFGQLDDLKQLHVTIDRGGQVEQVLGPAVHGSHPNRDGLGRSMPHLFEQILDRRVIGKHYIRAIT